DRTVPSTFTRTFTSNVRIPDGPNGAWVGWDVDARSLPTTAVVSSVTVREKVVHPRVGDLQSKLYIDSGTTWTLRNNVGGKQHNFDETKTNATTFAGTSAAQVWHFR